MGGTILDVFLLLVGFVVLIQSAKLFVDSSVNIAKRLKISTMVIGLTIVAMGTSAPEVVISVSAAVGGSSDLAIANVIGSNIFNLLFIVGFCALLFPISINMKMVSRDYWVSVAATALLFVMIFIFDDTIPRLGSLLLLGGFTTYMIIVVRTALKNKAQENSDEQEDYTPKPLGRSIIFTILGAVLIIIGGQLTVSSAVNIALAVGMTERIVGLTIVAMGTSLPELITTIIACRKGEGEFALGFIIGSSIFNIMFVLGIAGLVMPLAVDGSVVHDMAVLTLGTLGFYVLARSGKRLVRLEGLLMVLVFLGYMGWLIFAPT
ncbi:MAG: calcium/sodium antiporter [Oscillospiraceae bacterium]|nr:calcium/sodium antiporter [Oscillospiraceae bacterium]